MYADLKDKTALVTGAGKKTGIGYAIARKLAESGCNIVVADLGEIGGGDPQVRTGTTTEMEAIVEELKTEYGVRSLAVSVDVADSKSVDHMAAAVKAEFVSVQVLCKNAGSVFGVPNAVHTYDEEAWLRTIDINLNGVYRVSKAVLPFMLEKGGTVINVASQAAKKPPLFNGAYAAAKAGVLMMTKVMALELAANNIRVNAVCPGVILTDFTQWRFELEAEFLNSSPQERIAEKCKEIPLGRLGKAEEVASTVAFLASDASSYMTGQALNNTGGQTMEI
jgi:NAD(P)-dependent dehydrogenase (short-subunit alcohol dehydrogenase family)